MFVSAIFFMVGGIGVLLLIGFTSVCSFVAELGGYWVSDEILNHSTMRFSPSWYVSAINILINVLLLAGFKYYNFFVDSFVEAFRLFGKNLIFIR